MANDNTIDAAVEWLAKAQQLGFYASNNVRLIRAGVEAVRSVLAADEDRSIDRIYNDLGPLHVRLLNKADARINAATAQTYIARTKRLITDYRAWLKDPRAYKPAAPRGRGPAKAKRAPVEPDTEPSLPFGDDAPTSTPKAEGKPPAFRDHTLSLTTGKAYLRIPASISTEDMELLTLVIRSHVRASSAAPPTTEPPAA